MRNPVAAQSPQARSGSALPPLSPARSLPPLGGSARTRHSMQRATAGQDKGVLAGSYRERRYCSIAKRLSPAARSLASFPPRSSAARSRLLRRRPQLPPLRTPGADPRRGGQEARHHSGTAPPPFARPGPLRRRLTHGAGRPGRPPPQPERPAAPARPALRCARRPAGEEPCLQLAHRAEVLGPPLPGREGPAPPPAAALAEAMR